MAGKDQHTWPSDDELLALVDNYGPTKTAANLGVSRGAVAHRVRKIRNQRAEPTDPGIYHHEDGTATLLSTEGDAPWEAEAVLREHGINPDEWVIVRVRANRYGSTEEPSHQLRVDAIPKRMLISLPNPSDWKGLPKPKARKRKAEEPITVAICGDHHCPHQDPKLHQLYCQWLEDEQPDEMVMLGDLLDAATVSRHRERDGFAQPLNEGLSAAFALLMDYRAAAPNMRIRLLPGNHDDRIRNQIRDQVPGLDQLAAADDEVPALSMRRLLHLDELGIELIEGDWDLAKTSISTRLVAYHGITTSANATKVMLDKRIHTSTIQGHSHRMSIAYRTLHSDHPLEPPTSTTLAAEAGCMAKIEDGLGYASDPNWQQGGLVAWVWPDSGDFTLAPLVYVPERLIAPNGKRYEWANTKRPA